MITKRISVKEIVKDGLDTLEGNIDILTKKIISKEKGMVSTLLATELLEVLMLTKETLLDKKVEEQKKLSLLDKLPLVYSQINKI